MRDISSLIILNSFQRNTTTGLVYWNLLRLPRLQDSLVRISRRVGRGADSLALPGSDAPDEGRARFSGALRGGSPTAVSAQLPGARLGPGWRAQRPTARLSTMSLSEIKHFLTGLKVYLHESNEME